MQADTASRIVATEAALAAVGRLRAEHGPLMFFQSGGCCDGSSPMCFPQGELLVGPNDLLLGEIDGCPFYIDAEQYERWNRPSFVLDVAPGDGSGMSLGGVHDLHFVVKPPPVALASGRKGAAAVSASGTVRETMRTEGDRLACADGRSRGDLSLR